MKLDPNETAALRQPAELHQPHYSRPLGPQDMTEHQLRKMTLNEGMCRIGRKYFGTSTLY